MCEIIDFNLAGDNFSCNTAFYNSDNKHEKAIKGRVSTVALLKTGYAPFLDNYNNEAKVIIIDFFYPLKLEPDSKLLGKGLGKKCLDTFLQHIDNCQYIMFTSVTKKNNYMSDFLIKDGYQNMHIFNSFIKPTTTI